MGTSFSRRLIAWAGALLAAAACAAPAGAAVVSAFDADAQGWTKYTGGDPASTFAFLATGGNPDGHVRIADSASGAADFFQAPAPYLGDQSAFFAGAIQFDLKLSVAGSGTFEEILLSDGTTQLVCDLGVPTTTWATYTVALDASGGWHKSTLAGAAATDAEIQAVLAGLSAFRIRADHRSGTEQVFLDNVVLSPEPGLLAPLAVALLALRRRPRRPAFNN